MSRRHQYCTSSKIWIESTGNRWNSNGKNLRNLGVNLNSSKEGSSSCQGTMTWYGEHKEIMKIAWRIPCVLQKMPRSSRTDVGQFWDLVVRRSGTEFTSASQMANGTKLLKHDAQFCGERASCISCHQRFRKRRIQKQRRWKEVHSHQRK